MHESPAIRWFHWIVQMSLMLILVVFLTPCNGQVKKDLKKNTDIQSTDTVNENQATKQSYIDPLFYIDGQLCQHVRRIFQDKSGDLWFGTNVYGLIRYHSTTNDSDGGVRDTLEYFTEKDGLGGGRITGIVEDKEGNVWFGTYRGLTKYDGKNFTNFSEEDGLVNNEVWSLIIDSNGIFWIGTMEGVSQFDGQKFTTFPIPKATVNDTTTHLSYNRITCIMEDQNGTFWFGTDGFGISRYNPSASLQPGEKNFTFITKKDGLSDNNITHILEDKRGDIWIGSMYGGISRLHLSAENTGGMSFTNYTQNGDIDGIEVWSIYEDRSGSVWFPAENFGVYRYDPQAEQTVANSLPGSTDGFTNFSEKDGLNTNGVQCIFEDGEGRFWMGGWGGLFRYDPSVKAPSEKSFFSVTKDGP